MHPVVLAAVLLAALAVVFASRRLALTALLSVAFLTPFGQQVLVGGVHLFAVRIVILAGGIRLIKFKLSSQAPLFGGRYNSLDRVFLWWAFFRGMAAILLLREGGAVVVQMAFWLDAIGGYLLFRHLIRNNEDVAEVIQALAVVSMILAGCMFFEYLTRSNPFSFIGAQGESWLRDGKVRAQGVFANSITAGTFGATLLPLFVWLRKSGKARLWGTLGMVASTSIVLTSVASTAVSADLAGLLGLCMWPLRKRMRVIRWSVVLVVAGLALVMKAPVWYLIERVDFVGGHGWDRAYLVDQFIHHVSQWWLIGTTSNLNWGFDTWDACNQFVAEGVAGGVLTLGLFIALLCKAFSLIGKARKRVHGEFRQEWFFWCLGSALFAHLIAFLGIDYFDQVRVWWFIFLAVVSAVASEMADYSPLRGMAEDGAVNQCVLAEFSAAGREG